MRVPSWHRQFALTTRGACDLPSLPTTTSASWATKLGVNRGALVAVQWMQASDYRQTVLAVQAVPPKARTPDGQAQRETQIATAALAQSLAVIRCIRGYAKDTAISVCLDSR